MRNRMHDNRDMGCFGALERFVVGYIVYGHPGHR